MIPGEGRCLQGKRHVGTVDACGPLCFLGDRMPGERLRRRIPCILIVLFLENSYVYFSFDVEKPMEVI